MTVERCDRRSGLTMIELVLVISILSILAVVVLSKFYDMRTVAIENSEAYTIGVVQEGIDLQHAGEMLNP